MEQITRTETQEQRSVAGRAPQRLVSLDVFRGITIAGMILVNNPGSWAHVYWPLEHAEWHGWTPTDLIFPFFLFIVGVAMPFSFARRLEQGKARLALHIVYRSAALFLLGMLLSGIPDYNFSNRLILDVLQRIGVVYLLSGLLVLVTGSVAQAIIGILCLVIYWLLMVLIPVPGYGAGILDPQGNVWQYVDNLIIAGWHSHAEGVLSLIPSISTVLAGSLTGRWLRSGRPPYETVSGLFMAGSVGLAVGGIMHAWFPINKLLWSPSYVVFTAGFALQLLGLCYWLIDIKGHRGWAAPFLIFGMNAIAAFFLSSLTSRLLGIFGLKPVLYGVLFAPYFSDMNASLAWAVMYVLFWLGIMWILYRNRIFMKI